MKQIVRLMTKIVFAHRKPLSRSPVWWPVYHYLQDPFEFRTNVELP